MGSFSDNLSDIRSMSRILENWIPEVAEKKIFNDRLDNDMDKLSIISPALEEDIGSRDKNIKGKQIPQIKLGTKVPLFLTPRA